MRLALAILLLVVCAHAVTVPPPLVSSKRRAEAGGGGGSITIDAISSNVVDSASSSTHSHTCSGSNRGLFVGIAIGGSQSVSGVTYNGVAMTELWDTNGAPTISAQSSGYFLVNPASGANNVVVTLTGTTDGYVSITAMSLNGVNQTGGVGNSWRGSVPVLGVDGGGGPSVTIANSAANDFCIGFAGNWGATPTENQTVRNRYVNVNGSAYDSSLQSTVAAGANTVLSWTTGDYITVGAVAIIPQ